MSYTSLSLTGLVAVLVIDLFVARTRLTTSSVWWISYAIIVFFQTLTNGWLTGRRIVVYDPDTILGGTSVTLLGEGRLAYAPIEDLGFGFALVLGSCVAWTWLGRLEHRQTR